MSDGYIEAAGVWKKFRYGEIHDRLRDAIPALVRRAFGRRRPAADLWNGEFWALRDVSFAVRSGEALGIIGPNGAGKSTMLKLLTRIIRPTRGRVAARGRVGALIEVAAGFHPDLTGRENVFLQGAIMGMPQREIARKFDEIVEFSGIPWFIDMPVKRYSSGMQARLGFAIAAHLDPDVLIVDEVLAVGDAAFQQKAFARVVDLVKRGTPVVVVSHQLEAVAALCTQALYLDRGRVAHAGTPSECIAAYLDGVAREEDAAPGDAAVRILALRAPDGAAVRSGESLRLVADCEVREGGWPASESLTIRVRSARTGEVVFETSTLRLGIPLPDAGAFALDAELQLNVAPGIYTVESLIWDRLMTRQSFGGPRVRLEVNGGDEFEGPVQMHPRLRITAAAAAARAPRGA